MKRITSRDNPEYKKALKLTKRKYRDQMGLYLIEGVKPLKDALDMDVPLQRIFVTDEADAASFPEEITRILSPDLFKALSDTETSQGVIAEARQREIGEEDIHRLLTGHDRLLVLDRIQDPGNLGTMIRTAEAAGFAAVILLKGCADVYSPKVVRAAAGSVFRMKLPCGVEEETLLSGCAQAGRKIYVTALEEAIDYRDAAYEEGHVIIIGNEGQGVSRNLIDHADLKIKIPMAGAIESLNAAVAAGIIMYESQKNNVR